MCAAPIFLFTDFGSTDIYVGQVKAVLHALSPESAVIDLINDLAPYNVEAAAHLLPALAQHLPSGAVTICVVDPGVGTARGAVAVSAEERWFVAPDNGLVSVVAARSARPAVYDLGPLDRPLSASFHGRDLFAPHAAALAMQDGERNPLRPRERLDVELGSGDLSKIVHVDRYGNAVTGMRASSLRVDSTVLRVAGRTLRRARVFSDVPERELFWYENSIGLVEIAANQASAASELRLTIGQDVQIG
jgi:S-adenosyl-L-methionine hydrolase (adenosine-forming)